MIYRELNVPPGYKYISQWSELLDILPSQGKYILNKVNTGCGGTTLFLGSDRPCIMVSPRSNVLYSKAGQFPSAHLFRKKTDTCGPVELKQRLRDYIYACNCRSPWGTDIHITPKILVTIDSYPHVAEQLSAMGVLGDFDVVVDEFQCLMGDSKYKGRVDLEFLHNLRGVKSVCYMSATPIDENYLLQMPDFNDVSDYIRLVWDPSMLEESNLDMRPYKAKQSSKSIVREIIQDYRQNGCFASKIVNGMPVYATEVVIFLNDVRTTVQIIEENGLAPDEVNVLCSSSNRYVKDLKRLGVHIGELCTDHNTPVNRTFTFATRASFEGVDFYSTNAFTYIFSDGVLDWNRTDPITDVPQILGRQRLDQPFRKDAVLYYRADSKKNTDAILKRIQDKEKETARWIAQFNALDDTTKLMLKDGVVKRSDKLRYADDYVEFVDDMNGGFVLRENYLVKAAELRDWQMSKYVYDSPISIIKTVVNGTNINVTSNYGFNTTGTTPALDRFRHDFFKASTFPDRMRIYCDMRDSHPEHAGDLYYNAFIDLFFHQYYDTLGSNRIKALRYREKDIRDEWTAAMLHQRITVECMKEFIPGQCYRLSEVKIILQCIYDRLGVTQKAKANDITEFITGAQLRQLTTPSTGKRELYYEIAQ